MGKPFEVGDRVAVYGFVREKGGTLDGFESGAKAVVTDLRPLSRKLELRFDWQKPDDEDRYHAHSYQCRRLVKKPRRELAGQWLWSDRLESVRVVFVPHALTEIRPTTEMTIAEVRRSHAKA